MANVNCGGCEATCSTTCIGICAMNCSGGATTNVRNTRMTNIGIPTTTKTCIAGNAIKNTNANKKTR